MAGSKIASPGAAAPGWRRPPLIDARDLALGGAFLLLGPVAWCLPPRRWAAICGALGAALARVSPGWRDVPERVLDGRAVGAPPRAIRGRVAGQAFEMMCQILRSRRPGGWTPDAALDGREHIDDALARGNGAVLWVHRFRPLVHLVALHIAGFHACRPSIAEHGQFYRSRLGRRWFNPIQRAIEDRYSERVIAQEGGFGHLRILQERLRQNGLISIYCDAHAGTRNVEVPFLGCRIRFATQAPSLALEAGAPLLPVFPVADGVARFRIVVDAPLDLDLSSPRRRVVEAAVRQNASRLEGYVLRHPDQWRDWWRVVF